MKYKLLSLLRNSSAFLFISFTYLNGQNVDILASISRDMIEFNEVATITKQNEHYQPYIISVFKGKELETLGISNLKEALQLVPGVDIATDNMNNQTPIFRGSNPLAYGQSKLFIDGVLVNNVFFDSYSEYLGMPIEMIKRIEVVRGPGSKTNGVNAYAGSINIITYAEDFKDFESNDKLIFKYGSYNYRMGGFIKKFKTENLDATVDFYYQQDEKSLYAGPDGFSTGSMTYGAYDNTDVSQTGDAPLWLKDYSLSLNLKYYDLALKGRILEHSQGSAYGINYSLPKDDDRLRLPSYYLEAGYKKDIADILNVDIKAGIKYDVFDSDAKLGPDGEEFFDYYTFLTGGTPGNVTFVNGIYGKHIAAQVTLYQSSYLKFDGFDNHFITTGYRLIKEQTVDMVSKLSNWTTGDVALVDYSNSIPFFDKNAERITGILSLQDEYQFSDRLSFIYGFNYEKTTYKDAGFEPRVSMVYQHNLKNIYKAIYSRSHRNPSWQEMFTMNNSARTGSTSLDPETVDAFEFAYIQKFTNESYLQTNLFYLLNKNQIYNPSTNALYDNVLDTDIYGLELEYSGHFSSVDKFYCNYTYLSGLSKVQSTGTTTALTNVAHHLAKMYYIYNLTSGLSLSTIAKYVGSKDRVSGDSRDAVPAYTTIDMGLKYKNYEFDFDLTFSVKNIFNTDIKYPSAFYPYYYPSDYLQEGRTFLVTFKKEF